MCTFLKWFFPLLLSSLLLPPTAWAHAFLKVVNLDTATSPGKGVSGVTDLEISGSGFPEDTIRPDQMIISLAAKCNDRNAVFTTATSVKHVHGNRMRIHFFLPRSLAEGTYFISLRGTTASGIRFFSSDCTKTMASLEKLPDPNTFGRWTNQEYVAWSRNIDRAYAIKSFRHGPMVSDLPRDELPRVTYGFNGKTHDIDDYMRHLKVTGLLIIKDGKVLTERYAYGNNSNTLWESESVAKSIVATLIGVAVKDGYIASLNDAVTKYIPELTGSGYDGVTLRSMLQMTSGVKFDESDYTDPTTDAAVIEHCFVARIAGCALNYMKTLPSIAPQGSIWKYSSGEAFLTGLALQRATGQNVADYLQRKIWQPYGMESDGYWALEAKDGAALSEAGFNATLRDWGRFGLYVMNNGVLKNGEKTLPDHWMKDATAWTDASAQAYGYPDYGYMWWWNPVDPNTNHPNPASTFHSDWTFAALGIYGQMIAINQKERLIVVQWATWDEADGPPDHYNEEATFFNALIKALH
ncbi:MAG: serine hydrolase [Pseudomonadota bacterium]